MPLVRILVDGYSMLHSCREIASGTARYSAAARAELVHILRQYGDAISTPITVVFDGRGSTVQVAEDAPSTPEMEILYSKTGQTADDIIERVTGLLVQYGGVLVVSNDLAERDTVTSLGGTCCSCKHFKQTIDSVLLDFSKQIQRHNRAELNRFKTR